MDRLTEFLSDGIRCWKPICWRSATPDGKFSKTLPRLRSATALHFPAEPAPISYSQPAMQEFEPREEFRDVAAVTGSYFDALPEDDEVPAEILEFFQPEAGRTFADRQRLFALARGQSQPRGNQQNSPCHPHRKGFRAQVGLKRLGAICTSRGRLIGRLREGELETAAPSHRSVLESVDILKKTLHKQWSDETEMRTGVDSLLNRIAEVAPMDEEEEVVASSEAAAIQESSPSQAKSTASHIAENNKGSTAASGRQVGSHFAVASRTA